MFKLIKKSKQYQPKISLILLDWNVRESFHICHYLKKQTIPRDQFEIIVIEYYSQLTHAVKIFQDEIDTIAVLGMPQECYYHKHLMYNIGFLISQGEILVICDSDAMVKSTFIASILQFFTENQNCVLHLDQFRNHRTDFYPFSYPTFEEVIGSGCINYHQGKTIGVRETTDLLHQRNYGSCFCCMRSDYLAIGGSDEHIDFVGHICGPYDLTFRLINFGKEEIWHQKEFLYHTWHPGSDGVGEYMGPHDGYNLSTTSLEVIWSGRITPHVSHPLIVKLQKGEKITEADIVRGATNETHKKTTKLSFLQSSQNYAQNTYCKPRMQIKPTSKWSRLQFSFIFIFQKMCVLFIKKLPAFLAFIIKTLQQMNQQWSTFNYGTKSHMNFWHIISRLYAEKKPHYIIVNSQRDLLILSSFLVWKKKMTIRPHAKLEILYFNALTEEKTDELLKNGKYDNLHLTRTTECIWKKNPKLKQLKFSII